MTATINNPVPAQPTAPAPMAMADTTTLGRWLTRLDTLLVATMSVLAITPFRSLFVSSRVVLLGIGAVVLCLVVNLVLRRVRVPVAVVLGVMSLAGYLILIVYRIVSEDGVTLSTVWHGVTGSWANLLTATVPAGTSSQLASLPVILVWVAAEVGLMLSLRTRSATAPVVPSIVAFGVALLFTGNQDVTSAVVVGGFVVLALFIVLLRANLFAASGSSTRAAAQVVGSDSSAGFGMDVSRRSLPVGQLRIGAVVVVVVAAAAAIAGPTIPITSADARIDLHDRYRPPLDLSEALSPLATLRAGLNDTSDKPIFTVRFSGIPSGTTVDRVRSVVLDTYDGTVWGTDATFATAGSEIPAGEKIVVPTISIKQQYTVESTYTSSFVPALDRPVSVDGSRLGFDRSTGMLVSDTGTYKDFTYSVTSALPQITAVDARQARPGNDPAFSRLSLPPSGGWPSAISQFAARFPTAQNRYDQLVEIQNELLSTAFGYSAKARPGHSLGVITDFLTAPTGADGVTTARVGYAEQFAAAFAILARVDGMPSRVVVGYRVDPAAAAKGEEISVVPQDIHAWAEVNFNGVGWVAFDPTNPTERPPEAPPQVPETTIAPEITVAPSTSVPSSVASTVPPTTDAKNAAHTSSFPLALIIVPLVILFFPASIIGIKWLVRRRRRSNGDPSRRVVGAWLEVRDRLRVSGQPVERTSTVTEAAAHVSSVVAQPMTVLAPIVDRALYALTEPDDEMVAAAWEAESVFAKTVHDETGFPQRLRAGVNPKPLVDAVRRARDN